MGGFSRRLIGFVVFSFLMAACAVRMSQAAQGDFFELCAQGDLAKVQAAVRSGANPNGKQPNGDTALIRSLENPDDRIVAFLLESGARVDGLGSTGHSALFLACSTSRYSFSVPSAAKVRALIEAGADANFRDKEGHTPLIAALFYVRDGAERAVDPEVVRLLIEAGADVNVFDPLGDTPLYYAVIGESAYKEFGMMEVSRASAEVKELLLKAGAKGLEEMQGKPLSKQEQALIRACYAGDLGKVRRLLRAGVDPNARDPIRRTTPILAVLGRSAGDDDDSNEPTRETVRRDIVLVRELVSAGADPNRGGRSGFTPLLMALREGYMPYEGIQALLQVGADPNAKNAVGDTPLSLIRARQRYLQAALREGEENDREWQRETKRRLEDSQRVEKLLLKAGARN